MEVFCCDVHHSFMSTRLKVRCIAIIRGLLGNIFFTSKERYKFIIDQAVYEDGSNLCATKTLYTLLTAQTAVSQDEGHIALITQHSIFEVIVKDFDDQFQFSILSCFNYLMILLILMISVVSCSQYSGYVMSSREALLP